MIVLLMSMIIIIVLTIISIVAIKSIFGKIYYQIKNVFIINFIDAIIQLAILVMSILSIVGGTYNPFIYFQF